MGRPPIGKTAMTGAERVQRYRLRHASDTPATKPTKADDIKDREIASLQARIAELEAVRSSAPELSASSLPTTARDKLEAALRQHKRKLNAEFELRVQQEVRKRLDDEILPRYSRRYAEYEKGINSHRGYIARDEYITIWRCLHPDSRNSATDEMLARAFDIFSDLKRVLVKQDERKPLQGRPLPRTFEELEAARRKVQEERRAKRATSKASVKPR
jgi:hypothetical protein